MLKSLSGELNEKNEQNNKKKVPANKYFIEDEPKIQSQFDLKRNKELQKNKKRIELNFNQIDDDEPERSSDDEYEGRNNLGRRLHFWIFLKQNNKRDIKQNIFIEPATGRIWPIEDSPSFPFQSVNLTLRSVKCSITKICGSI
jgi:hypothetical protein